MASLLKNTEDRYGDYVRELQGRNIGLTQELDDSRKERGKLEGRFDEFRVKVYDLVTKLSTGSGEDCSYTEILVEFCRREGVNPDMKLWSDLNNIEVLENWLMLLDRMELFTRAEDLKSQLSSVKNDYESKLKSLLSGGMEKETKSLRMENLTLREEIEKYKELLHKSHINQKQFRKRDLDQEFNFLKAQLETKNANSHPIDLTGMLATHENVHASHNTK